MSKRIFILANHLGTEFPTGTHDDSLDIWRKKSSSLNKRVIHEEFLGPYFKLIDEIRLYMESSNLFDYNEDLKLNSEQLREKVMKQLVSVYKAYPMSYEKDLENPNRKVTILYAMGEYDVRVLGC